MESEPTVKQSQAILNQSSRRVDAGNSRQPKQPVQALLHQGVPASLRSNALSVVPLSSFLFTYFYTLSSPSVCFLPYDYCRRRHQETELFGNSPRPQPRPGISEFSGRLAVLTQPYVLFTNSRNMPLAPPRRNCSVSFSMLLVCGLGTSAIHWPASFVSGLTTELPGSMTRR
jgi:hypothetical protein